MKTLYLALLLGAWNLNLSEYSTSIPFGEVRINPASLPWVLAAIYGEPLDGEVECEMSGFSRLCRGEFHDEIC